MANFFTPPTMEGHRLIKKVFAGKFYGILQKLKFHIWNYFTLFSEEVLALYI